MTKLIYAYKHFYFQPKKLKQPALEERPSVSICIAARNEEHALDSCLEAVIASDYPKLEVIVLDDESVDNTSVLIKSFAASGIRFVEGGALPEGWMGRNYAYQRLLEQASGKYVFYISVDTHIAPDTISQLVAYLSQKHAEMLSILPVRTDNYRLSVLFAPLRFLQEVIFNNKHAPGAITGAWMINRQLLLHEIGGFTDFKNDILAERHMAQITAKSNDYCLLVGRKTGVSFEKKWSSQVEAATRTYGLTVCSNIFKFCYALLILIIINTPLLALLHIIVMPTSNILIWATASFILILMLLYFMYLRLAWSKGTLLGALLWPVIAAQELIILIASLFKRWRGTLSWKGRTIYKR
ncbi:glycosyltransferase [Candidatus Saccharibacteria bacterium]|nr:glycosyltransferase [Candidatus Saccharibacteria bacterium]